MTLARYVWAGVVASLVLLGCAQKDPVVGELEQLDQVGRAAFTTSNVAKLQAKISTAVTNEDKAKAMGEVVAEMEKSKQLVDAFQPKTPEVQKLTNELKSGMEQGISGAKEAQSALAKANEAELMKAMTKMNTAQDTLNQFPQHFMDLAKAKGYKPGK